MDASLPLPSNPHKSCVNIVESPVAVSVLAAVGITVSVPTPRLFFWTKFKVVNDCAAPTVGTNTPSSCKKIPTASWGAILTHRIPSSSLERKKLFWPGVPVLS